MKLSVLTEKWSLCIQIFLVILSPFIVILCCAMFVSCPCPLLVSMWLPKMWIIATRSHNVDSVAFWVLDLWFVILKFLLGEESRVKILSEYWRRCFNSIRFIIDLSSSVLKFSYLSSGKLQPVLGLILVNTGDCLIPVLCTSNSKLSFILIISVDLDGTVISILACHIHSVSYSTLFIP